VHDRSEIKSLHASQVDSLRAEVQAEALVDAQRRLDNLNYAWSGVADDVATRLAKRSNQIVPDAASGP